MKRWPHIVLLGVAGLWTTTASGLNTVIPTDLDQDDDVDDADIGILLTAYTGVNNGPPFNTDADFDGDGDVDESDISEGFAAFTGVTGGTFVPGPIPDQYDLIYIKDTGELSMVVKGNMLSYALESKNNVFLEDNALTPTHHQTFVSWLFINGVPFFKFGVSSSTPEFLGEALQFQDLPVGTYSLGLVMSPGLTEQQFLNTFDRHASYVPGLGLPETPFNLVYVPEPTSLLLLGIGGLLITRRMPA